MMHLPAVGFALVAALCVAMSAVSRQREAARLPEGQLGRFGVIGSLVRRPNWWLGTAVGAGGYVFQALALGRGSVLLVQSLLVTSLLFALPLAAAFAGRSVRRAEWIWAGVLVFSIVVFVVVGDPRQGKQHVAPSHWAVTAAIGIPLLLICLFAARGGSGHRRALLLGLASGTMFAVAAVLTKSTVALIGDGAAELFTSPVPYALVVVGLTAVTLQQNAYHAGDLQASLPAATVAEPVLAATLGVLLLDEYLDIDRDHLVALVIALATMVAATLALARSAAAEPGPADALPAT